MPLIKVAYLMLNFLDLKSFLSNLFFAVASSLSTLCLNHNWSHFVILSGLTLHQFKKKLLLSTWSIILQILQIITYSHTPRSRYIYVCVLVIWIIKNEAKIYLSAWLLDFWKNPIYTVTYVLGPPGLWISVTFSYLDFIEFYQSNCLN